jgi:hypothetical protein
MINDNLVSTNPSDDSNLQSSSQNTKPSDDSSLQSTKTSKTSKVTDDYKKSPLDILEEILDESDEIEKKEAEIKAKKEAQEEAAKAAEIAAYEAEVARQKQLDQERLSSQLQELKTIEQTPQYQARKEQIEDQKNQDSTNKQNSEGFEINQIDHKKVSPQELGLSE